VVYEYFFSIKPVETICAEHQVKKPSRTLRGRTSEGDGFPVLPIFRDFCAIPEPKVESNAGPGEGGVFGASIARDIPHFVLQLRKQIWI